MADGLPRQSPLAHLGLDARAAAPAADALVTLAELPPCAMVNLRCPATPEVRSMVTVHAGCGLPLNALESARHADVTALWLGPDEFLISGLADGIELAETLTSVFQGTLVTATDVSDAYCVLRLAGPAAAETLSMGCSLDLHPRAFGPGRVARTLLAQAGIILHQTEDESYEIYVRRSYADYLWHWLMDAGRGFGIAVQPP
ncbi:MAG: sarcosine oxidase subunit gamma [Alphaproteobacteria bacterium]|nr:sarcosine oxidase subunit gamma [Alphaproteobacteria bacterium]